MNDMGFTASTSAARGRARAWAHAENIATVFAGTALVLGLYAMDAGPWSALGALVYFNVSTFEQLRKLDL